MEKTNGKRPDGFKRILARAYVACRKKYVRFQRLGGFPGFIARVQGNLREGDVKTIGALAIVAIAVIGIPALLIAFGGKTAATPASGNAEQTTLAMAAGQSPAGQDGVFDLTTPTPAPTLAPTPSPTPEPTPTPLLFFKGVSGETVISIQERLMELGYMEYDEPTDYYGSMTKEAVELFQRTNELDIDGYVGETTYNLLMTDNAKKYMVKVGIEGTDVTELQKRLRALGYIETATGYFGTDTEAAVKKFQERNDLTADGMVGTQTREKLYSEDVVANAISYGEKSDEVKKYQQRLSKLGYLTTEPDGNFGSDTVAAVKLFQQINGVIADGYVGPETKELLMSSDAQPNAMTIGISGKTVEKVQSLLKKLGYMNSVTGYYGSGTESAVRAFQERNGLSVDGKVGRQTMSVLTSDKAKRASSTTSSSSGGSSSSGSTSSGTTSGSTSASTSGASLSALISVAKSKLGCKYVLGAKGPSKFDCSGFVYYCLNQAGVKQGYMTSKTWRNVDKYQRFTSMSGLKEGDILVFRMSSSSGHVAIALGDGTMIHASSSQGKVLISNVNTTYWNKYFYCGYRIF